MRNYWDEYMNFDHGKKYTFENISYSPDMKYDEYCALFRLQHDSILADAEYSAFRKSMGANRNLALYEKEYLRAMFQRQAEREEYKARHQVRKPEVVRI